MKTCPACRATYDDAQNFCLNDGSNLVAAAGGVSASESPTQTYPYDRSSARTDVISPTPTAPPTPPNPYAPQIPPPASPYIALPPKKSPLPLLLILGGVVIAGVVTLVLVLRGSSSSSGSTSGTTTSSSSPSTTSSSRSGQVYDSPDGRFTITLPAGFDQFKSQKTKQPTVAGDIELTILQTENSRGGCMVGFSDFPEASFQGRTPQKMLEDGRDGALRNISGTLEKQENITVQGRTGIAIYGSGASGGRTFYVRFNFILDKPRAYQVGFLAYTRDELDKPDISGYLNSFKLK